MANKYFCRQLLVALPLYLHSLCDGVSLSLPGIVNSVILAPNSTGIRATPAQASQIAAIPGLGAFIGVFFLSALLQNIGRRRTYFVILTFDLLSWTMLFFANSVNVILAARLFRGLGDGLFVNGIMISEFVDPIRRGYFSTVRKMSLGVGALVSHSMALRYTYREISVFPIICLLSGLLLTYYWPESPAYSAYRGRFEECQRNFVYLHGNSKEKRNELENLMGAQMARIEKTKKTSLLKSTLGTLIKKDFLKAVVITTILIMIVDLCGRHYYLAFINQVFLMIVGDQSVAAYCSILSDALTILSLVISSFVVRCFKRRLLVFMFGLLAAALISAISIAEFLKTRYSIGIMFPWIVPAIMLVLNFFVNMGVVPVNLMITVEIYPVESRGLGLCISSLSFILFAFLFGYKVTPMMVKTLGLGGTFGIFSVGIIICIIILYFILPETKDRPMQDIEDEVKNVDKSVIELRPMLLKEKLEIHT